MRLRFVSAPGGSAFMHELLGVVAHEASHSIAGTPISGIDLCEGPLDGADDDVFVVVPHEYFRVLPEHLLPSAAVRRRTIGFCVEHPGTDTFVTTLRTVADLGACVDINDDSALALHRAGIAVERYQLGYSDRWDRWGGSETERDIDVLYLGTVDPRRSRLLTQGAEALANFEVLMAMPPHEPMTRPRPDFFMGEDKLNLLTRSTILLNLHREASRSFEWVRALEAICNGCVVVSEHSRDFVPLVAGRHVIAGAPHRLNELARALLEHPERVQDIREEAYRFVRDEVPMRPSAAMLVELASRLAAGSVEHSAAPPDVAHVAWPSWSAGRVDGAVPTGNEFEHVVVSGVDVAIADVEATVRTLDDEWVLLSAPGDVLFENATSRLEALLAADPALDAVYGFVITADDQFSSALPFEPTRLAVSNYLSLASMWRRRSLVEVLVQVEPSRTTNEFSDAFWRTAAAQARRVTLLPRPVVRNAPPPFSLGGAHTA